MHQGPRPTFDESDRTLEVHLFGVDDDLYDVPVKVCWVSRLRDVRRFPDTASLKAQIDRDFAAAQDALTAPTGATSY